MILGIWGLTNSIRADTVGELKSAVICVSHMPSLKAKKLGKLTQEKVVLEHRSTFANSIRAVFVHLESSMATAIRARSGRDKGSTVPTLLTDRIRLWKAGVHDLVMELCCALHSFRVRLMPWQLMVESR